MAGFYTCSDCQDYGIHECLRRQPPAYGFFKIDGAQRLLERRTKHEERFRHTTMLGTPMPLMVAEKGW